MSTEECINTVNLRNIEFLIQEAFVGVKRNGLMAFASISTIALSLGVLGAFVLAALGVNNFAAAQIGRFEIAVFMDNEARQAQAEDAAAKIRNMKAVGSVTVKDRDKDWAEFKRQHPDIESAGLPLNPLPYAMIVKVSDPSKTAAIANDIRAMPLIDRVNEGRTILGRVMAIAKVVKVVSVLGAIVLLVTAVFIISNAIKLTLYARRREIRIMQLVGATNWFIRVPLIMEGVAFGAAGALVAWLLLQVGTAYLSHVARRITPLVANASANVEPAQLVASLVILGVAIGAAGSFVSIRRFLHD